MSNRVRRFCCRGTSGKGSTHACQTAEASSLSDEASASTPPSPGDGSACGRGRDSGGLVPESAPPSICSVKSSRASTEWSRTARSATSAFMASMSRESPSCKRSCDNGDILPTTHWQRSIPAAPMAPPLTKMASAPMMISGSMRTLPGSVKPATKTAGGISAERGVAPPSPLPTIFLAFGFRAPASGDGLSMVKGRHGSITVPASPATILAMSGSAPMVALLPVFSTKVQAASTFGPIEPAGKA